MSRYEARRESKSYVGGWLAEQVLNAVDGWASDCFLLRETCCLMGNEGRLDGLLVPMRWTAPIRAGLYGVEVKVSRSDFLRGINSGQFEKYQQRVHGLYVATPPDVCKTSELPTGVGHLLVKNKGRQGWLAMCRKKAVRRTIDLDQRMLWSILYDAFDQQSRWVAEEQRVIRQTLDRINGHIGHRLIGIAAGIEREIRDRSVGP